MKEQNVDKLTSAFHDFTQVVEKFEQTYKLLQDKIESLDKQLENKNVELERKVQESENIKNFLNNILDNVHTGVLAIDMTGNISLFNKAAEMITGFDKEDVIDKSYRKIFFNNSVQDSKSAIYTLSTGNESFKRQKQISTYNSEKKNVEFSTSIVHNYRGEIDGVVETFTDISEIKELQERISHIETLAALGEMSASVAHEIRNPLAAISGFTGLLDRQIAVDDPRKKLLKPIIEGVSRLDNIVSNLLTLTRPQTLNINKCNIHNMINDIIDFFKMGVSDKNKTVDFFTMFDTNNTVINCDGQLIQQVLTNIIRNAWEAIEEKGKITISTKVSILEPISEVLDEDEIKELIRLFSFIEIQIEDTGAGIDDKELQKIFNPFFSTKNEGNGLGLAICKKIVQLHKGDIHVYSKTNKGTKFVINLPLYENYSE
ncbi:MAG: ATP-binding protein [Candidatus Cloacimonadales bacterium]|jgi:PAS domain S-box-containing protein|nr:PAS domain S-box protein [Candidatus Cloacimonadota bacterium]MDD2649720.1 ATP-binding protein [Candidatus Cloacimonadota bacterium]MDX9977297.1 ATP-binding protein [Candidatus Cloacimonadales bacterium]